MAATALTVTPPPLTAEDNTDAAPSSHDLTPLANDPSDVPPHSQELETLPPPAPSPPHFLNSIAGLKDLSSSISGFLQCYDDLDNHLESIKAAISAKMPPETPHISQPFPLSPRLEILEEIVLEEQHEDKSRSKSELESLCNTMCSRGVRKYMVTHLPNLQMLREEVPKALRQAPNPSKLVLECLGKFFLQGSKAFTRNSPMIPAREASILVLECFVLMMGLDVTSEKYNAVLDIEKTVKEEADVAALTWRKRLVAEGGVSKASQIDARGLLLFVASFGIPALFKVEDIRDLVIAGNAKEIVGVLQKSHVLMSKIAEIVEEMMKKKMEVDAVDIVYTFGLEERFNPQTILISFLRESKETWKKPKKGSQGSPATLNEANKKQWATLKSISKCLERHGIDPAKLLPGWQISEKIVTLEKDITDFDRKSGDKTAQKRKSSETETSNRPKAQEAKRPRHVGHGPQQQRAAGHVDSRRSLLDSGLPKHVNSYGAPAVVYGGPGAGLLPESMIRAGVGASSHGGILPTYAVHEGVLVDAAGQLINHGTHPYAWHRDSAINERYTSQPPPVGLTALYRASTSIEGFPGNTTSSVGLGNRGSASDLYQFADSVAESELYPSSVPRSVAAGSSAVPAHLSSYLYQS